MSDIDAFDRAMSDIAAITCFCDPLEEEPPCDECAAAMKAAKDAARAPLTAELARLRAGLQQTEVEIRQTLARYELTPSVALEWAQKLAALRAEPTP